MKAKHLHAISLASILLVSMFSGYGGQNAQALGASEVSGQARSSINRPAPVKETLSVAVALRTITDMAGRSVTVPARISKVFPVAPVAAVYLYTIDPDRLLGWNYKLNDFEKRFVLPRCQALTVYGMQDSVNYEAVIAAGPQMALMAGSGNSASIAEADKLSSSLGIPVVMVSDRLEDSAAIYRFLGDLFGISKRGEELAAYIDRTFADIKAVDIPKGKRVTVYYGNEEDSLQTAPSGSTHSQIIDLVKAVNVADVESKSGGRVKVSLEQVMAWNPDVIIVNGEPKKGLTGNGAAQTILRNPDYAQIKAVRTGKVFGTPKTPFSWIDRPPGPNRVIGMRWLAAKLYPDYFNYQIETETRIFYKLFYHIDLTDEQLKGLFND